MSPRLRWVTNSRCRANASAYPTRPRSRTAQSARGFILTPDWLPTPWVSSINRHSVNRVECLAHRFVQRRMRMDGVDHRLDSCFRVHRGHSLADQLERLRSDDVHSQDFAQLLIRDHFYESVVTAQDAGFAVGREREFANLHLVPDRPRLRLRQANASDARFRERHVRNPILIHRRRIFAGDVRHRDHSFRRRHMRELWSPCHDVANRINAGLARALKWVDFDEPAIQLDLRPFESDVLRDGLTPHRYQQRLDVEILLLAVRKRRREP